MIATRKNTAKRTPYHHIVRIPGVCGGDAVIDGTRLAVWMLVNFYEKMGRSVEKVVRDWDALTPSQVFSALAYYHDHKEEIDRLRVENSYEYWKEHYEPLAAAPAPQRTSVARNRRSAKKARV